MGGAKDIPELFRPKLGPEIWTWNMSSCIIGGNDGTHNEIYVSMVEVVEGYIRTCCRGLTEWSLSVSTTISLHKQPTPSNSIHSASSPSRRGLDCSEISPSPSGCVQSYECQCRAIVILYDCGTLTRSFWIVEPTIYHFVYVVCLSYPSLSNHLVVAGPAYAHLSRTSANSG